MSLVHAILGVLEAQPMNGYELAQFFENQGGWVWKAPHSQIYPQLRKMEKAGLVVVENQIRGAVLQRKVYSITDSGLAELKRWVATPLDTSTKRDPVFLQALLFDLIAPEEAIHVLNHVIQEQEKLADEWARHAARLRTERSPSLLARLAHRPRQDHDHIADLKARVFEGSAAMARARIEWARGEAQAISSYREHRRSDGQGGEE